MEIIRIPRIMQQTVKRLKVQGRNIGLVPTMGALHGGHLSLVRCARAENDIVVASIFVNPLQFGPSEDLARYPRMFENDCELLKKEGTDILLYPDVHAMYGPSFSTSVRVDGISGKLCGAFRPGHFDGVATVVAKLILMTRADRAYFGQKDYQQTVIIRKMVDDLNMDVEIIVCPTVREPDGLAMSSRNRYLTPAERESAPILHQALRHAEVLIRSGKHPDEIASAMREMLGSVSEISEIRYAGIYDPATLDELKETRQENLVALAVRMGKTRLIDNIIARIENPGV